MPTPPEYISSTGDIIISYPYVIFDGLIPKSVTWSQTAYPSYIIANNTNSPIPLLQNTVYFDTENNRQTSIPPGEYLIINVDTAGNWIQQGSSGGGSGYTLPVASSTTLGGVKDGGDNITIDPDGTINAVSDNQVNSDFTENNPLLKSYILHRPTIPSPYVLPPATSGVRGGIKIGSNLTISGDLLSGLAPYTLPIAGAGLGGVKGGGANIAIAADGTISSTGGGGSGLNQLIGDVTAGPGTGSQVATLSNTGVTAATYGDGTHVAVFTVNAKGRITAASTAAIPGVAVTSFPTTDSLGLLHNGTDQTAALNTIASNANYKGMIMDFLGGGAITISGTVNFQGKVIVFMPGTYFTGSGTITNHKTNPLTIAQKCYDPTVNITNSSCGWTEFSAQWYGAIPDNLTDNGPLFEKCSSMLIANSTTMPKIMLIPYAGNYYRMDTPWKIYNFSGGVYQQVNLTIIGQDNAQSSPLTGFPRLRLTYQDTFGIGIQHPNGGAIRGISIEGPLTTGISKRTMINTTFSAVFPSARNSQYSPFSLIVMDPFRGIVPPDGGYPGLTAFYQGVDAIGGGTDFFVQECHLTGATVGVMFTPNGKTQQGEDCGIRDCEIVICNVAVSWGQAQSDKSFIRDTRHWYYVWTVIDTFTYGQGPSSLGGTIEEIDGMNIAGYVKRLFNIKMVEKHCSMRNVYCESLYEIGIIRSDYNKIIIEGSTFIYEAIPERPQFHMQIKNVEFHSCLNKYYDDLYSKRTIIDNLGGSMFQNCMFDQAPMVINPSDDVGQVVYINSTCFDPTITKPCVIGSSNYMTKLSNAGTVPALYGTFTMQDFTGLDSSDHNSNGGVIIPDATVTYSYASCNFDRWLRSIATSVVLTVDDPTRTASFTTTLIAQCKVNDYCIDHATGFNLGRISTIVGSTITLIEIPDNISSGTYTIDLVYWLTAERMFMGDIVSGSPNITNFVPVFNAPYVAIGARVDNPAFAFGTYIVSYNNTTKVAVLSTNALVTRTRVMFANGNPEEKIISTKPPTHATYNAYAFGILTGAIWIELPNPSSSALSPVTWVFNIGGTTSGTAYYGNKADYNILYLRRIFGGVDQYFDPYLNSWVNV